MKVILEISEESLIHALDEVELHTDEGSSNLPFPPSAEWCEFQISLREAYENATIQNTSTLETGVKTEQVDT